MELSLIISIFLGVGLATAVGFRVFLPLLILSICTYYDIISLQEGWQWVGSIPALVLLATATVVEILGYYIPWVDNLLDTIAVPLAGIAGTAVMLATLGDLQPLITWSLAIIAGGGTAAIVAGTTSATRAASTVTTGGLANPVVSTVETGVSVVMSIISIFIPILAVILAVFILFGIHKFYKRLKNRKRKI
tara:strand:- start:257 stop:829 length:573 start_codon:yes stop_codon:yes gene_type:complete